MSKLIRLFSLLFFLNTYVQAADPNISVKTAILMDYDSEEILYELEPDMNIFNEAWFAVDMVSSLSFLSPIDLKK